MRTPAEIHDLLQQVQATTNADLATQEEAVVANYEQAQATKGSIFVRILTVAGGIFSMALLILFLAIAGAFDTESSMILIGSLLAGAGLFAGLKIQHLMLDTISVTLFIAGLAILVAGLGWGRLSVTSICLILLLIGGSSLVLAGNYVLAFVAALVVLGSLYFLPTGPYIHPLMQGLLAWGYTLFLLHEAAVLRLHRRMFLLYHPIRLALICTMLALYGYDWMYLQISNDFSYVYFPYGSLVVIAALLYASAPFVKRMGFAGQRSLWTVLTIWGLLLLSAFFAPDILCALLILLVSFGVRDNSGLVLGIAGVIYYTGQYYYDLQITLLTKSILLLIPGIVFLVLYFVLTQHFQRDEKI